QNSIGLRNRITAKRGTLVVPLARTTLGKILPPAGPIGIEPVLEQIDAIGVARYLIEQTARFVRPQIHQIPAGELAIDYASGEGTGVVVEFHGKVAAAHLGHIAIARLGQAI